MQKAWVRPTVAVCHPAGSRVTCRLDSAPCSCCSCHSGHDPALGLLVSGWWLSHFVHRQQISAFPSHFLCGNAAISMKLNTGQRGPVSELEPAWPSFLGGGQVLARILGLSDDLFLPGPGVEHSGDRLSFHVSLREMPGG